MKASAFRSAVLLLSPFTLFLQQRCAIPIASRKRNQWNFHLTYCAQQLKNSVLGNAKLTSAATAHASPYRSASKSASLRSRTAALAGTDHATSRWSSGLQLPNFFSAPVFVSLWTLSWWTSRRVAHHPKRNPRTWVVSGNKPSCSLLLNVWQLFCLQIWD